MMVTDEALHADDGVPHLGPKGWFGIQDGGASSMVIGHNTLMKVMDHLGEKGVKTATYKFHPTEKVFAFGGDARREAAWSVRLPVFGYNNNMATLNASSSRATPLSSLVVQSLLRCR